MLSIFLIFSQSVNAKTDKTTAEYLRDKKHFSIMNPLAENIAEKAIKNTLKKEIQGKYKVNFDGYTLGSMKVGIFKNLVITGKKLKINDIEIPYVKLKSITDYNWIDYKQDPIVYKTDMTYAYEIHLSEESINIALKSQNYRKNIEKINKLAYPLFMIYDTTVKIKNDKLIIMMEYNLPLSPHKKNKVLKITTGFMVHENKIYAHKVALEDSYKKLPIDRITNLLNLLDPLTFTLSAIDTKKCNGRIENVKIIDDIIQINGKIFIKGEK